MPLGAFLGAMTKRGHCSGAVFVISMVYVYRLKVKTYGAPAGTVQAQPTTSSATAIPSVCPHCLFVTSLVLANKYVNDEVFTNKYWASWAGMSAAELAGLEQRFLESIDYRLHVKKEVLDAFAAVVLSPRLTASSAAPSPASNTPSAEAGRGTSPCSRQSNATAGCPKRYDCTACVRVCELEYTCSNVRACALLGIRVPPVLNFEYRHA